MQPESILKTLDMFTWLIIFGPPILIGFQYFSQKRIIKTEVKLTPWRKIS